MNRSQDLYHDLYEDDCGAQPQRFPWHFGRPGRKSTPRDRQLLTAIRWYNRASTESSDGQLTVVHLAIAFEALLICREKTASHSVSRKLSRFCAVAFQDSRAGHNSLRCALQHCSQGDFDRLRFFGTDDYKNPSADVAYRPLAAYGRQIFSFAWR